MKKFLSRMNVASSKDSNNAIKTKNTFVMLLKKTPKNYETSTLTYKQTKEFAVHFIIICKTEKIL